MVICDIIHTKKIKKETKRSKKLIAFLGISFLLFLLIYSFFSISHVPQTEASPAWLVGWSYRKAITIDHTYVDADLSYFPLYVKFTNDADIGDHALATGYDIRFTTNDETTLCEYERISWSGGGGDDASGEFFVRVPTIYGASNTTIYTYYGNSEASDASSPEDTFPTDDGWVAVWHLEEEGNGTEGEYKDSTSNDNDGQGGLYGLVPSRVTGVVGYGQDYEQSENDIILAPSTDSLILGTSDFTFSAFIKTESVSAGFIAYKKGAAAENYSNYFFSLLADSKYRFFIQDNAGQSATWNSTGTFSNEAWNRFAFRCDRDSGTGMNGFLNGVKDDATADPTAVPIIIPSYALGIGGEDGGTASLDGILDEVRLSKTLRSDAWIKFEYRNMSESDNEISFSGEYQPYEADVSVSATVAETAELIVYGTTTGFSINGATTSIVTTTSTVPLGQLSTFENSVGAQILNMSTNAGGGYTVTIKYDHKLWSSSNTSTDIDDHTGSNATPTVFSSYGTEAFGYTTEDFSLSDAGEGPSRFSGGKWAGFSTDTYEVAYHTSPVSSTTTKIGFQAGISVLTPAADDYGCQVTYTMTGTF